MLINSYFLKYLPTPLYLLLLSLLLYNSVGPWAAVLYEQMNQVSGQDNYSFKAVISHMNSLAIGSITPLSPCAENMVGFLYHGFHW